MVVSPSKAVPADVPSTKLLVPAPIKVLTSASVIPVFKLGVEPLDVIAGVPVSDTLALFVAILLSIVSKSTACVTLI